MAKTYRHCSGVVIRNKARTVLHDDRFIRVYTHNDCSVAYFDYTEDWFKVLASPSKHSFNAHPEKELQIEVMEHRKLLYPGRLAYLYYEADMPAEKFLTHAVELNDRLTAEKKQVDHVNNNRRNHCSWNLKAIDGRLNGPGGKGDLVARIKWPYFVSPSVTPSGEYLVEYGYISPVDDVLNVYYMRCPTDEALYTFLTFLMEDNAPLELSEAGEGTPEEVYARNKQLHLTNTTFACGSFGFSVESYDRKMSIPLDEYPVWII